MISTGIEDIDLESLAGQKTQVSPPTRKFYRVRATLSFVRTMQVDEVVQADNQADAPTKLLREYQQNLTGVALVTDKPLFVDFVTEKAAEEAETEGSHCT